jgi:hypothetical protein
MRADFERALLLFTGQNMDYHVRAGTGWLDFAWDFWQQAEIVERDRCAAICEGVCEAANHAARDGNKKTGAMTAAALCAKLIRA